METRSRLAAGVLLVLLGLISATPARAQSQLDPRVLETVTACVFEVAARKPPEDSIRYAERLPLELLPFAVRHDQYEPLGTAFAIGANRFVSAAHVFALERPTLRDELFIRAADGAVYPVDVVWSYSSDRDFVVFSVAGWDRGDRCLALSDGPPPIHARVYAVGNAYGEGIVVRDGTLTSTTPESEHGEWNWLRFSAAASLGNSGGPLVDASGRALGVVTARNETENLNYALPASEVLRFPARRAALTIRWSYRLPNMDAEYLAREAFDTELPCGVQELRSRLVDFHRGAVHRSVEGLLAERRDRLFPQGPGARELLDTIPFSLLPMVAMEKPDGVWRFARPEQTATARIGADGSLECGRLWDITFLSLSRPAADTVAGMFRAPQRLLDLVLEGYPVTRQVGAKRVRITSLGAPSAEETFEDSWGRRWLLAVWDIAFADSAYVMLALPTPAGVAMLLRLCPYWQADAIRADFHVLAEFFHVSYRATFADWKALLGEKALVPGALSELVLEFAPGGEASIGCPQFRFRYGESLMPVKATSILYVMPAYCRRAAVAWEVARVYVASGAESRSHIDIEKLFRPSASASDGTLQSWAAAREGRYPFDRRKIWRDGASVMCTVLDPAPRGIEPRFVYALRVGMQGDVRENELRSRLHTAATSLVLAARELEAAVLGTEPPSAAER